MNCSKLFFVALMSSLFLASCSNDDNENETPLGSFDNGVLILNQGNFAGGNSAISYLSDDFASFQNNIFSLVNPTLTLGDTGQDIGFYNELAFVVLNYSNKIEIVNRYTMASIATIDTQLNNPRYIAFANGKGYVTNWGDGGSPTDDFVAVIDLNSYDVLTTIPVAEGPERIVENNNKLYVAHAGGYGYGSTISVISASSNTVTATIPVGDVPNSLVFEDGSLYAICGGKPSYATTETAGELVKINVSNNTVTTQIDFPIATHPSNLVIEDNAVYYTIDAEIYKKSISDTTLPTEALFTTTAQGVYGVYSFAVHNNKIYVGDAADYNSNGKIYIYSALGWLENDYTVGVIPAGFYFND
jgi:YVTN family beta-propeller protein